ncbi:MAG TPA: hypothetical protein VKR52_14925 [Terracidiphilus sp.]|nr:hypothetical protein [Terracidiphilus sp.]
MQALLSIFRIRQKSLVRANILTLGAFLVSLRLAGFPNFADLHGSHWQIVTLLFAAWGMGETARCIHRKWDFYHGGVLLLLYTDLMIMIMIVFLIGYP